MPKIIGMGHISRVGKDTLADMLKKLMEADGKHVQILPFAKGVKEVTRLFYPLVPDNDAIAKDPSLRRKVIKEYGKTPVELWVIGNKLREFDQDIWVRLWKHNVCKGVDYVLVPDVRYANEAQMIKDMGGLVIKVYRDGCLPICPADEQLIGNYSWYNHYIENTGSLEELETKAKGLYEAHKVL